MKLSEPATAITDYILAVETVVFGILLLRSSPGLPVKLWGYSFLALAVAAVAGGTYHGFIQHMSAVSASAIWKLTLYSIGVAAWLMLSATIFAYSPQPWRTAFLWVALLQFVIYAIAISQTNDFRYVIYSYVLAMIAILLMATFHRNIWLIAAVAVSFFGAAVQRSGIGLHRYFNHNDIYHVIQMAGMYFFYRGGKLFLEAD